MDKKEIQNLAGFFFEVGTMRKIIRMHRQVFLTDDLSDSIASHSFRVAVIGSFLARELDVDVTKVMQMCLLHDVAETRSGDQNWIHKRYVKVYESEITKEQLEDLPFSKELSAIMEEYAERKTEEACIAKDADLLDQILLLREYVWQGNKEAADWLGEVEDESNSEELLHTDLARKIAKEIKRQPPHQWWNDLETPHRR